MYLVEYSIHKPITAETLLTLFTSKLLSRIDIIKLVTSDVTV